MKQRTAAWVAWGIWALTIAGLVFAIGYGVFGHSGGSLDAQSGSIYPGIAVLLFVLAFATVGALVASRRPSSPIGWLLLASGLCDTLGVFAIFLSEFSTTWSDWLGNWVWGLGIAIPSTFVLLLFPTGTLPSRRWRPVAWFAGAVLVLSTLGNALAPGVIQGTDTVNPLGVSGSLGQVFSVLEGAFGLVALAGLASLASLVFRFRRADQVEREQLKWLVYTGVLLVAAVIAGTVVTAVLGTSDFSTNIQNAIVAGAFACVPVAIGVAVLKYRLYDIDLVINKTVVYAALAVFITAVYIGIVVGLGALVGNGSSKPNLGLSIVATALVAVAFQPVRSRVQRLANRVVYGHRATPYQVLSEFSSRMAQTYSSEELLPRMARILAEGTGAKTAVVWLRVGQELRPGAAWPADERPTVPAPITDEAPTAIEATLILPVEHQGELLGALSLTKAAGDRLSPAEEHLARDLASGAGLVLRNVRLTEELLLRLDELQASRQRIVAAQDAERRRLERNIHDGAQQQLVALAVKTRLARGLLEKDPERATEMLSQVEQEVTQALEDLRDLARGIYPPLLADSGLVAALRSQAAKASIPVTIEAHGIVRYPQEQEAAVYFCVLEALQNVAKYAHASATTVRLAETNGRLTFEVEDDGVGFDSTRTSYGTGLQGMADRLAALGAELHVYSTPGTGTIVRGSIPAGRPIDQLAEEAELAVAETRS